MSYGKNKRKSLGVDNLLLFGNITLAQAHKQKLIKKAKGKQQWVLTKKGKRINVKLRAYE